jgi:hypothetical protein
MGTFGVSIAVIVFKQLMAGTLATRYSQEFRPGAQNLE